MIDGELEAGWCPIDPVGSVVSAVVGHKILAERNYLHSTVVPRD